MVTTGVDGTVKVWDTRKWAVLNEYQFKKTPKTAVWSQKGLLGLGWGNHVSVCYELHSCRSCRSFDPANGLSSIQQVFKDLQRPGQNPRMPPPPYMTHTFPGTAVNDMRFCPFDDVLGVGHGSGFTSLIIPGAGEANFDSLEADPFEGKRRRREREVNSLLDKIPFDMITLDTEMVGKLDTNVMKAEERINPDKPGYKATPYAQKTRLDRLKADGEHQEDEEEDSEAEEDVDEERRKAKKQARVEKADAKNRARGRNSTLKKMLRKRRRNVVDPQTVSSLWACLLAELRR